MRKPFALLADPVLGGDANVVHVDEAGVAGVDPELAVERAGREALHAPLQHEGGDAPVALRAVDRGEDEEVVGDVGEADPDLLAVEHVGVAVAASGRGEVAGVRADARLREAERGELLALRLGHEPALLLLVRPPLHEGQRVQPDVDALDDPEGGVGPLELLADHREADVVHARAAPAGVDGRAEQAELAHAREHLAVDLALLVPLADVRQDLGLGELTDRLLDEAVLVGRAEVDHRRILGGAGHTKPAGWRTRGFDRSAARGRRV